MTNETKTSTAFFTRDREAGNLIERFRTCEDAEKAIIEYEKEDLETGVFVEGFYEVYHDEG